MPLKSATPTTKGSASPCWKNPIAALTSGILLNHITNGRKAHSLCACSINGFGIWKGQYNATFLLWMTKSCLWLLQMWLWLCLCSSLSTAYVLWTHSSPWNNKVGYAPIWKVLFCRPLANLKYVPTCSTYCQNPYHLHRLWFLQKDKSLYSFSKYHTLSFFLYHFFNISFFQDIQGPMEAFLL